MKIILALAASLTLAGTAVAAISPNPSERQAVATAHTEIEMAKGPSRNTGTTPNRDKNAPSGGKTLFG